VNGGVNTHVTLTCEECGTETEDDSSDATYCAEVVIDVEGWGYNDKGVLMCAECLKKEEEE